MVGEPQACTRSCTQFQNFGHYSLLSTSAENAGGGKGVVEGKSVEHGGGRVSKK